MAVGGPGRAPLRPAPTAAVFGGMHTVTRGAPTNAARRNYSRNKCNYARAHTHTHSPTVARTTHTRTHTVTPLALAHARAYKKIKTVAVSQSRLKY